MEKQANINHWKNLDLTAKYAQLNTLRKLAVDISFQIVISDLHRLINARINSLQVDLQTLAKEELTIPTLPLNVESVCVA